MPDDDGPTPTPTPTADAPGTQEMAEALGTTPADVRAHAEELGGVKEGNKWKFPQDQGAFDENGMSTYKETPNVAYTVHPLELPTNPAARAMVPDYMIDDTHMSDSPGGSANVAERVARGKEAHGLAPDDNSMTGSVLDEDVANKPPVE